MAKVMKNASKLFSKLKIGHIIGGWGLIIVLIILFYFGFWKREGFYIVDTKKIDNTKKKKPTFLWTQTTEGSSCPVGQQYIEGSVKGTYYCTTGLTVGAVQNAQPFEIPYIKPTQIKHLTNEQIDNLAQPLSDDQKNNLTATQLLHYNNYLKKYAGIVAQFPSAQF